MVVDDLVPLVGAGLNDEDGSRQEDFAKVVRKKREILTEGNQLDFTRNWRLIREEQNPTILDIISKKPPQSPFDVSMKNVSDQPISVICCFYSGQGGNKVVGGLRCYSIRPGSVLLLHGGFMRDPRKHWNYDDEYHLGQIAVFEFRLENQGESKVHCRIVRGDAELVLGDFPNATAAHLDFGYGAINPLVLDRHGGSISMGLQRRGKVYRAIYQIKGHKKVRDFSYSDPSVTRLVALNEAGALALSKVGGVWVCDGVLDSDKTVKEVGASSLVWVFALQGQEIVSAGPAGGEGLRGNSRSVPQRRVK